MDFKQVALYFITVAPIVFVVSAGVTYMYSYFLQGAGVVDWGRALQWALILGIFLTFMNYWEGKKKG